MIDHIMRYSTPITLRATLTYLLISNKFLISEIMWPKVKLPTKRIIDYEYFMEQLAEGHGNQDCHPKYFKFLQEERHGVSSTMHYRCEICVKKFQFRTSRDFSYENKLAVKSCLVAGMFLFLLPHR